MRELFTKQLIFVGEVKEASGTFTKIRQNLETILFLDQEEEIIELTKNDWLCRRIEE